MRGNELVNFVSHRGRFWAISASDYKIVHSPFLALFAGDDYCFFKCLKKISSTSFPKLFYLIFLTSISCRVWLRIMCCKPYHFLNELNRIYGIHKLLIYLYCCYCILGDEMYLLFTRIKQRQGEMHKMYMHMY